MAEESGQQTAWIKPALVVLIFVLPVLLAYVVYFVFPSAPGDRTNRGELLVPAQPLPELVLADRQGQTLFHNQWTLLVVAPQGCAQVCQQRLQAMSKIRALLREDRRRVQQVLVTSDTSNQRQILEQYPVVRVHAGGEVLTAFFSRAGAQAVGPGVIYLIDPLGNWVLYYPADRDAAAAYKDLQRLLKLSGIG